MFKDIPSDIVDMKSFWKHSIACGVNARIIASYQGIQNTERLFLSGLLHDISRLILYNYAPKHSKGGKANHPPSRVKSKPAPLGLAFYYLKGNPEAWRWCLYKETFCIRTDRDNCQKRVI